jgi:hypothetical protein
MPRVGGATALPEYADEAALGERWAAGVRGPLRLEDGRALRVVFPGVAGGASGPDFIGAILDAGGDLLRGDVELHLRASGWRTHGHHRDPAYTNVVLHVAARNDTGALTTLHSSGRAIPVLVLAASAQPAFPPPFTPPCALQLALGRQSAPTLERMSLRRLRAKAARVLPLVRDAGPAQALYTLALEQLGGAGNREPFAALARRLPLAALLERLDTSTAPRAFTAAAELKGAASLLALRRAGLRPMAAPAKRLEAMGALAAAWWPAGSAPEWPARLPAGTELLRPLPAGIGRGTAIELALNAILPVALACGEWSEEESEAAWLALPSPGTYGKLRFLEGWLTPPAESFPRPFTTAARLQGGIALHTDYCTKGACGRCPLSE